MLRTVSLCLCFYASVICAADGPFSGPVCSGTWSSIRTGHELVYLDEDRLLDWEPATGRFRVWRYDRLRTGNADPLPGKALTFGTWKNIGEGHQLIYLGGDRVLDWEAATGQYRVWIFDRSRLGEANPFLAQPEAEGTWGSIKTGHRLIYMGSDVVLDWEPGTGRYRFWGYDREAKGAADPFPGKPLATGFWKSIRDGHQLLPFDGDRVLDWEESGAYRIWSYDLSQRDSDDPFPGAPLAKGAFKGTGPAHRFILLDGDRILQWNSETGAYLIWSCEQGDEQADVADLEAEQAAARDAAAREFDAKNQAEARARAAQIRQEVEAARREALAHAVEDARKEAELERIQQDIAALKAREKLNDLAVQRAREEAQKKYEIEKAKRDLARAQQEQQLAKQRAIALTKQAVVVLHNPLSTSSQGVNASIRWKLWDGSYTAWGQSKIPDKRSMYFSCKGGVSLQIKFGSTGAPKNYSLEANQIPSDIKPKTEDGRPYTFVWPQNKPLDLCKGAPRK